MAKAVARGATRTMKPKAKGQKAIKFKAGGLHASTGTPAGQPIPKKKLAAAASGKLGPKAQKQARFAINVLGVKKPGGASKPAKGARRGSSTAKKPG